MPFQARTVRKLLDDLGQQATLKTYTEGTYNPSTGTLTRSNTTYTVKVYPASYKLEDIDGTNVVLGDKKIYLSARDTSFSTIPTPEVGDEIVGLGDAAKIVRVQEIYSQGELMCYICQTRE